MFATPAMPVSVSATIWPPRPNSNFLPSATASLDFGGKAVARASLSRTVSGLNQNGIPNAAIFGRDYGQLDFSGNVDLAKVLGNAYLPTLVLNVININKEAQSSYFQFPNATFNEYQPGRTVLVGVRGRF